MREARVAAGPVGSRRLVEQARGAMSKRHLRRHRRPPLRRRSARRFLSSRPVREDWTSSGISARTPGSRPQPAMCPRDLHLRTRAPQQCRLSSRVTEHRPFAFSPPRETRERIGPLTLVAHASAASDCQHQYGIGQSKHRRVHCAEPPFRTPIANGRCTNAGDRGTSHPIQATDSVRNTGPPQPPA